LAERQTKGRFAVDVVAVLEEIVTPGRFATGDAIHDDYTHDEAITATAVRPDYLVRPVSADEVSQIIAVAAAHGLPVTARGSGTGLSGACVPCPGGIVVSFERMAAIVEIDVDNHVAVVQPGVTLEQLDRATAEVGLAYTVFPGEYSASLGGNVATNAGGMRAVKYGVTRHQVLGLEAVLGTGEIIRSGGKFVKATTGYDLTQLIIGSEGTLALVTEATLKLYPRAGHQATVLAPFRRLEEVTGAVPRILGQGIGPVILEYLDLVTMAAITSASHLDLGIPADIKDEALAYLVVVLEDRTADRLDQDIEELARLLCDLGALDAYVLPPYAGTALIEARERAFWTGKAAGMDDLIDMVVPRAQIPEYLAKVGELAAMTKSWVNGCGHVGDGNVHLSVFQRDPVVRHDLMRGIFETGMAMGGAISGEHGIGSEKKSYYTALEDPAKLALMQRIKTAFDPHGILNPGTIFDPSDQEDHE
jgi:glycolate oxidase